MQNEQVVVCNPTGKGEVDQAVIGRDMSEKPDKAMRVLSYTVLFCFLFVFCASSADAKKKGKGDDDDDAPTKGTFYMEVSRGSVMLEQSEHKKKYFADGDIGVAVSSWLPWQVRCSA